MKRYIPLSLFVCLLFTAACENNDKLSDTRLSDQTLAAISLSNVTVEKYDATFNVELKEKGNPAAREYGVLVSEEPQPSITNSTIIVADMAATTSNLKHTFSPGTTYYVCAYALTANQFIASEVKQFKTAEHPLKAFIGSKTLSGYSLITKKQNSAEVTITFDDKDETVAYLKGLSSEAGVNLALEPVKMIFDLAKGTVTIPDGQIATEKNYGNYSFVSLESNPTTGGIVGSIENKAIKFNSLGAVIVAGNNNGLFHWAYSDLTIQ